MLDDNTRAAIKSEMDKIREQMKVNLEYFDHNKSDQSTLEILQGHIEDCLQNIERLTQ